MYVRVRYPGSADVRGAASPRLLLNLRPVLTFNAPAEARRARPPGGGRGNGRRRASAP